MGIDGNNNVLSPARPHRTASPSKGNRQANGVARQPTASDTITVFVATCQTPPFPIGSDVTASLYTPPVFKQVKFQTIVRSTATVEDLRYFLMSQWVITKSPYAQLPPSEQFYTFKGRILRLDGTLDGYYIAPNDTIYLRFASLGKVLDPWAMSTSELRAELKSRNAYETKFQPEQLMARLVELTMKESRLQRLQQATKREQLVQVEAITNELVHLPNRSENIGTRTVSTHAHLMFPRPTSLQWPHAPSPQRTVFLSITQLERTYQAIPRDVLDPAILIFDIERKWVFDKHNVLQINNFDYRYMRFDADFLEFLTLKEEMGLVFWFRPHKSYDKLSTFFEMIDDPVSQKQYAPLMLKETKWLTLCGINGWEGQVRNDGRKRDMTKIPKFTTSIPRVTTNLRSQSFDYIAVQELLYQSNPTILFAPL